jgi:DNA topoisomerase-2
MSEFKILSERDHIRQRSAMYIGSITSEEISGILNFKYQTKKYIPGLVKIIEEIYQNSVDEAIRTNFEFASEISVTIKDDGLMGWYVEVIDNGRGIPTKQIDGKYQAELSWTRARAGSNFSDDNRTTIGMNGIGSYLTTCFSKEFIGQSGDGKLNVIVRCLNGCETIETVAEKSKARGTRVKFYPDLSLFKTKTIDNELIDLIEDRLMNLAICYPKVTFKFNDKKLSIKNSTQLAKAFHESALAFDDENFNLVVAPTGDDEEFRHLSFFNGIAIKNGGNHIDYFISGICNELIPLIKRKWKIEVLPNQIKQHLLLAFWVRNFPNPKFDSQSKERITNTIGEIKSFMNLDFTKIAKKIAATDDIIMPAIESILRKKEAIEKRAATNALKKVQKKKIANHIAANDKDPEKKTLYIAEGLSASGMGLSVRDPKYQGFYSLRGKVLNTHDMSAYDILKNKELSELIAIIGLDLNNPSIVDEEGNSILNYGRIAVLTDADQDGASIFCLLLMFFSRWPELFSEGRLCRVNTPLYIARKKGKPDQYFYTSEEYDKADLKGWTVDYMKGLGSLEKNDYKRAVITEPFMTTITLDDMEKLNMSFGNNADKRKEWMIG